MRASAFVLLAMLGMAACQETTAPGDQLDLVSSFALNGGFAYGVEGGLPGRGLPELRRLSQLPAEIALTDAQEAEISALLEAFQDEYQDELDELAAIHERAHKAREDGATRDEVHDILEEGQAIRAALEEPLGDLRDAINAVLTDAQKEWLTSHQYRRCDPTTATALTAAQKAQIAALRDAFLEENQADLDAVKAALEAAHAARQAGKTQAEVQAILATVEDAMERLRDAGGELRAAIDAVLTAEQRASNCFGRSMGPGGLAGGGGHGGRGGRGGHMPRGW